MDDVDRVLADCVANPDDDGPRLVWADLVGGERGELVVLQCDLARGDLTPAEAAIRRRRERELLERNAIAWAALPAFARRWSFRRGFVEAVKVGPGFDPALLPPLVSSLVLDVISRQTLALPANLRALGVTSYGAEAWLRPLPQLRAFGFDGAQPRHVALVRDMIAAAPIERLRLREHQLDAGAIATLLDAAPGLVALDVMSRRDLPIEDYLRHPLRSLCLAWGVDLRALASCPTLVHLGFACVGTAPDDLLDPVPQLRTLEIDGNVQRAAEVLLHASLPALRVLRFVEEPPPAPLLRALADRFDLELLEVVAHDELLHASPAAMFALGDPWFVTSAPACLVRLDTTDAQIFEIPPYPADKHVLLGRSQDNVVPIFSGTVARRHAALTWSDGHHEIRDLGSTNGVIVGTQRIDRVALHDGDEVILGEVILRYFVGPGARARAEQAIARRGG